MRARRSTIGLSAGSVVTSSTRRPSIHTWRPSRIDSRYSAPVRITVGVSSGDLRQDDRERVVHVLARASLRLRSVAAGRGREDPPVAVDRAPRLLSRVAAGDAM